ncbi:helix-turn-helix domain-containing protein [Clostridium brassicae]|uniref:Helix-turn-helix domain-containing protein n=1 Tax=Clostridium brassicae TaxID=2999072 RepID=A0ABT4D695_9CLOT|nr:helix-turn-helix domain-containing protein [Clostridium brassicae]MCY6957820.1 helix-turn-helix domain-containing protein [Clostridium brassicae]
MSIQGIGERIKSRRKNLRLTLRELGAECGVSATFLSDIETGKSLPSMERTAQIAKALKVPISWLLGEQQLENADDVIVNSFRENGMLYEIFLDKHVFPNGLTYEQMCDKIKTLEKMEKLLNKNDD